MGHSALRNHLSEMNEKKRVILKNSDVISKDIRKLNNAGETFITESGVYDLIFKSRKAEAIKFKDWVTDGKEYAVGSDVAKCLGYANVRDALSRHCLSVVKHDVENTRGQQRETVVIPEGDIYRLIVKSKLPQAVKFEKWRGI